MLEAALGWRLPPPQAANWLRGKSPPTNSTGIIVSSLADLLQQATGHFSSFKEI
jgi:hypothetical protein